MSDCYYLDENKNAIPCDMKTWSDKYQEMSEKGTKHIAHEEIDGKRISTIWLGIDYSFVISKRPLIFETMIFDENDEIAIFDEYKAHRDIYCERYSTWQEAEEGHKRAVQWVKDGCKEEENCL